MKSIIQQIEDQTKTTLEPKEFDDLLDSIRHKHNGSYVLEGGALVALNFTGSESPMQLELSAEECASLQYLNLSGNKGLAQLTFAAPLPVLREINLSECALEELTIPAGCSELQKAWLQKNQLKRMVFEAGCPKLLLLDLAGNQLEHFYVPSGMDSLAYLYLNNNQLQVFDMSLPMDNLDTLHLRDNKLVHVDIHHDYPKLLTLYLEGNQLPHFYEDFFEHLPNLAFLTLKGNPLRNLPKELFEKDDNVCVDIRNTITSLGKGKVDNYEVKMVLVGNSSVGKTTLIKYLKEGVFEEGEDTTHGIKVTKWEPENENGGKTGLVVYAWDFGGQEYYHATHRLFLSNNAVYCLLWNKATNVQDLVETVIHKDGKPVKQMLDHYPFDYWLENIRHYAETSPLLLVQSKDQDVEVVDNEVFEKYKIVPKENYSVCIKSVVNGDASKTNKFKTFKTDLYQRFAEAATAFPLGKFWAEIKDKIRGKALKGEYRWTWQQFKEYCQGKDKTMSDSELETFAKYLKEIGVILHYPEHPHLKDTVFINPIWVTDMIYDIFDESLKARHGVFDLEHIVQVLKDKARFKTDKERQELALELIDLMRQFELIFSPKDKPDVFIAIQYLQNEYENKAALERLKKLTPQLGFVLHFPKFLSKSVFHRFIAEFGRHAVDDYWKYGIFFTHEASGTEIFAECKFKDRKIEVWTGKEDKTQVLSVLFQRLFHLNQQDKSLEISRNGADFVSIEDLEEANELKNEKVKATNQKPLDVKDFDCCLMKGERGAMTDLPFDKPETTTKMKPKIYFSYAWGDPNEKGNSRELIVNTMYESLMSDGFNVIRDKMDLGYGGLISDFMEEIGQGDLIVVFISDKYLRSAYCMWELCEIHRNSQLDKDKFVARILPVRVENLNMGTPNFFREFFEYWQTTFKGWQELERDYPQQIGAAQRDEFTKSRTIKDRFGEVIGHFQDMNAKTNALLAEDNFAEIKQAIIKRTGQ